MIIPSEKFPFFEKSMRKTHLTLHLTPELEEQMAFWDKWNDVVSRANYYRDTGL